MQTVLTECCRKGGTLTVAGRWSVNKTSSIAEQSWWWLLGTGQDERGRVLLSQVYTQTHAATNTKDVITERERQRERGERERGKGVRVRVRDLIGAKYGQRS